MKKLVFVVGLIAVIGLSSCSFESYQCAAYPSAVKSTKYGEKAQSKYIRKH